MSFGEEVRTLRIEKGLKVRELASLVDLSHSYLSQIENGKKKEPKSYIKKALLEALGVRENEEFKTDNISSEFGKALHKIRNDKNLSIRELAKQSGTSHPYLSQLETGKRNPPKPEILRKLAKGLKISYVSLLIEAEYLEKEDVKEYIQELL